MEEPEEKKQPVEDQNEVRMSLYIAGGLALGSAIGVALDNVALWLSLGLVFGAALAVTKNEGSDSTDSKIDKGPPEK